MVDALDDDLEHVGAEELARQEGGALRVEPVPRLDPAPVDQLEDERALGHVRMDHARDDERLESLHERSDQLRVVRLLDEVELPAEVELELVRQLLELDPLRLMNVVPGSSRPWRNARAPSRVASRRPATPTSARTCRSPLRCATRPTVRARRARSRRAPRRRHATVCDLGNAGAGRACAPRSRGGRRRRSSRSRPGNGSRRGNTRRATR